MAQEKKDSKELLIFREYSSKFKGAILHPTRVASQLYSSGIIDEHTRDEVSKNQQDASNILVNAVEVYIWSQPKTGKKLTKKFEKILEIFTQYVPLNIIVAELEEQYYGIKSDDSDVEVQEETLPSTAETTTQQAVKKSHKRKKKAISKPYSTPKAEDNVLPESFAPEISFEDTAINKETPAAQDIEDIEPVSKSSREHDEDQYVKDLTIALQVYTSDLNESGNDTQAILSRIKSRIENHIKKRMEDGLSKDTLTQQLSDLNTLIPADINYWCYDKLEEVFKEQNEKVSESKDSSSDDLSDDLPPVHFEDAVYHASLCGFILWKSNQSPKKGSNDILSRYGHNFDEVSISVSGNMRMLIAHQENTVYISFMHHEITTLWEGTKDLPFRYFYKLLDQNKRLVLTGFSHGGLTAWSVLAQLWSQPYFSSDVLLQNVTCVMFGLPGDRSSMEIKQAIQQYPDILQLCHIFLLEEDLYRFLYQHMDPLFLQGRKNFNELYYRCQEIAFLIHQTPHGGLNCSKPPLDFNIINTAISFSYEKATMEDYHQKVIRGYLDKEGYSMPARKDLKIGSVKSLMPLITEIELHQHKHPGGSELAIVINGDNLWFCNGIEVELPDVPVLKVRISAENVTQNQIQYNRSLHDHDCFMPGNINTYCHVTVYSKFANPHRDEVLMVYNEPDTISFRQSQLAKQTPSEIIKLSFLSALLEQSPSIRLGRTTKRFGQIMKFLQEVSSIVPMESAFFAVASSIDTDRKKSPVASSTDSSANRIIKAVVDAAHASSIPISRMMAFGCVEANKKLQLAGHFLFRPNVHGHYPRRFVHSSTPDDSKPNEHKSAGASKKRRQKKKSASGNATPMQENVLSVSLFFEDYRLSYLERFRVICDRIQEASSILRYPPNMICGRNIGDMYPISKAISSSLKSDALTPLSQVLKHSRKILTDFAIKHDNAKLGAAAVNTSMLEHVNKIVEEDLKPCVTMLGGFMEQQIHVPMVNNELDTAKALRMAEHSGAIGVWALFALSQKDIISILSLRKNQTLVFQISKFIEGSHSEEVTKKKEDDESVTSYNAKLQFLLQGMKKTVTCSSNYISYSLERELVEICKECDISASTKLSFITDEWNARFQNTALALIPYTYRPLLARWLIWSLNIHQLREGLASYTTVGVIGLVNSGKSTLVNKVFKIETVQGTSQSARTTVPFIYNLDSSVEGLSVIDFPGVDDQDESIGDLAKLLVGLAQMVIFVCGYERFHTKSAKDWMKIFEKDFATTPILVCLTHADKLYEEKCDDDMFPVCPEPKIPVFNLKFQDELEKIIGSKLKTQNRIMKFCSLAQGRHSPLNNDKGRQSMRNVGFYTPEDIGKWIKQALNEDIQQKELAEKFESFLV